MTDQATRVVSAGWYQDPASAGQVRWWNGVTWTDHVHEKPSELQDALGQGGGAQPAADSETQAQRLAAARDLEHQFGIGTAELAIVVQAGANPHGTSSSDSSARRIAEHKAAAHASTAAAWMIALSPVLALVLGIVAAYISLYVLATPIAFVLALAVPYLLCVLWALGDRRTLRDRGFTPPSAKFALLTGLGYLIARRKRIPGSGPIAMLIVVAALAFGVPALAVVSGQTQGLTNALNIQRTISADYLTHGKAVQVNCPPFVDTTTVGSLYTCDATMATGVHRTIWVSIDGANGKFSYSFGL